MIPSRTMAVIFWCWETEATRGTGAHTYAFRRIAASPVLVRCTSRRLFLFLFLFLFLSPATFRHIGCYCS